MPKPDWHNISVRTSPQMRQALRELVMTGFYGFNIEDAAERIIAKHIERELIEERGSLRDRAL